MTTKRTTWKERRERQRKANFVGRQDYLLEFSQDFKRDDPQYLVFSVIGEGGVGKSTLLGQYANVATESNAFAATCDDRQASPASAMGHIASELAKRGIRHDEFDDRYKKYRELRDEIERDPNAPRGAMDLLARGVTDFAIKSGRRMPGVGIFVDGIDEKAAGETVSQLINYGITRWGNKDEVLLLKETDRVLTPLFLSLLAKAADRQRVLLIFDVFERTKTALDSWLHALFNFDYGELDGNLCFVIAGRDPLEQHWTELAGSICHVDLIPFTQQETKVYLGNQGISNEQLVNRIHEDTGGLPVLVELLASAKPQPSLPLPDVSRDAVERFLQWVSQPNLRRAALLAAVPRRFNQDILGAALGTDASETFQWLSTQSFVRRRADTGWFYHERVRELMLRNLRHTTVKELEETHARLAAFFATEQGVIDLEPKAAYQSESWKSHECERIYHLLSAQPDRCAPEAVNAFLHAYRWGSVFAERVAPPCRQAGLEKGSVRIQALAHALSEFCQAYDRSDTRTAIGHLRALEEEHGLTATAQCEIQALYGDLYEREGEFDRSLACLNRALEIDDKYAWAFCNRGWTHLGMGSCDKAIDDLTCAVELDEKYVFAFASRGEAHRMKGSYNEAIADFTRAIKLDEKADFAFVSRGETYRLKGSYNEAIADFTRAIDLDEKNVFAFDSRGEAHGQKGSYDEAIADFTRAIDLDEKNVFAFVSRGEAHGQKGSYDEAIADFTRAIDLDEKNSDAFASRGEAHRKKGSYDEAIADFTRAIDLDEKNVFAFVSRGEAHGQKGSYDEAIADFTRAIDLDEKNVFAFVSRGEAHGQKGSYDKAIADFTRALDFDEQNVHAFANRSVIYRMTLRYEEALSDSIRAIELDAQATVAHLSLIACYRKLDRMDEFHGQIEAVSGRFKQESAYNRACFAAIRGDTDHALALLRSVLEKKEVDAASVDRDPDWFWLREDPRLSALLIEMIAAK